MYCAWWLLTHETWSCIEMTWFISYSTTVIIYIYLTATLVDTISKYMVQYVDTEHKSTILCRPNVLKDRWDQRWYETKAKLHVRVTVAAFSPRSII